MVIFVVVIPIVGSRTKTPCCLGAMFECVLLLTPLVLWMSHWCANDLNLNWLATGQLWRDAGCNWLAGWFGTGVNQPIQPEQAINKKNLRPCCVPWCLVPTSPVAVLSLTRGPRSTWPHHQWVRVPMRRRASTCVGCAKFWSPVVWVRTWQI
jgi:hypothetical protein